MYYLLFLMIWVYHYLIEAVWFFFHNHFSDCLRFFEDLRSFSLHYLVIFSFIFLVCFQMILICLNIHLLFFSFHLRIFFILTNYSSSKSIALFLILYLEYQKMILVWLHNRQLVSFSHFEPFASLFWLDLTIFLIIFTGCLLRKSFFFHSHQ